MATALAHHVMMRLEDRRVMARSGRDFRAAAGVILAQGSPRGLLAFRVVDSHAHALLVCDRPDAGAFAHHTEVALRHRLALGSPFERARIEPVRTQSHLANTFHYVLRQEERHGTRADAAHDGSALVDLLGLRVVAPDLVTCVHTHLPRVHLDDLLPLLGADLTDLGAAHPDLLAVSAAAAFSLPAVDRGPARLRRLAIAAAVHVGARDGARPGELAERLGVSGETVRRLRNGAPHRLHVQAVRRQALLRATLRPEESPHFHGVLAR